MKTLTWKTLGALIVALGAAAFLMVTWVLGPDEVVTKERQHDKAIAEPIQREPSALQRKLAQIERQLSDRDEHDESQRNHAGAPAQLLAFDAALDDSVERDDEAQERAWELLESAGVTGTRVARTECGSGVCRLTLDHDTEEDRALLLSSLKLLPSWSKTPVRTLDVQNTIASVLYLESDRLKPAIE